MGIVEICRKWATLCFNLNSSVGLRTSLCHCYCQSEKGCVLFHFFIKEMRARCIQRRKFTFPLLPPWICNANTTDLMWFYVCETWRQRQRHRTPWPFDECSGCAQTDQTLRLERESWGPLQTGPALPVTSSASHWLPVVQEERSKTNGNECVSGSVFAVRGRCVDAALGTNVQTSIGHLSGCYILRGLEGRFPFFFFLSSILISRAQGALHLKRPRSFFSCFLVFYARMERSRQADRDATDTPL